MINMKKICVSALAAALMMSGSAGAVVGSAATGSAGLSISISGSYIPSEITNFKVKSNTNSSLKLTWSKVKGADGYKIYRYNYSTKKWQGVKNVSSGETLSWTDSGLNANTVYKYRIKPYRVINGKTKIGEGVSTYGITNVKNITKVSGHKILRQGKTQVAMEIKFSTTKNTVSGYTIYIKPYSTKNNKLVPDDSVDTIKIDVGAKSKDCSTNSKYTTCYVNTYKKSITNCNKFRVYVIPYVNTTTTVNNKKTTTKISAGNGAYKDVSIPRVTVVFEK